MAKVNDCILEREDYVICDKSGIKTTVRDLQLEVLTVMDELHRVCVKNKIDYALIAGSALGMVNYKGFIPWDDDIDVCVKREDWNRFIEALKKDLGKNFYFQCFETDKRFNTIAGPSMKIRKKNTFIEETNFLLKNRCKSGDGIFVDVIIYDHMSENKFIHKLNRILIRIAMVFIVLLDNLHINPIPFKKFTQWLSKRYSMKNVDSKLSGQTISYPWTKLNHDPVFLNKDIYPFKLYDFEGRKFYSFNNIEKVLKEWYSPNCLKKWDGKKWVETLPVEKRKPKHTVDLNLHGSERINEK